MHKQNGMRFKKTKGVRALSTKYSDEQFKSLLDENYAWPSDYIFKFIVPNSEEANLLAVLPKGEITKRSSSSGKYTSITATIKMNSSDEVLQTYAAASHVNGLISL